MERRSCNKKIIIWQVAFVCILLGNLVYGTACREEPSAEIPRVEELQFTTNQINLKINERQAVKINVKPTEAKKHHNIEYNASVEGYVSISEASNDGCVLTGEKGGTVVLIARADGYTAYLEVHIDGEQIVQVPYIQIPTQVIELIEGSRRTVQVNLFNGSAVDQQQFRWAVESGKDNISISPTGNTVVVQGEKRGSQKIIVTHDKSEYPAEILVFVLGAEERVNYITTAQNVIQMVARGENKQFSATLVNGGPADTAGFLFKITETDPCIDIFTSNNSCNIMAKWKGTAVIRIQHPLAEYALDVRVIVLDGEETYIELDKTFVLMDIGQGNFISASMGGAFKESWNADFSYKLKGDDCVEISQTNFSFYAVAKKNGRAIIEIANKNIQYSREALIVVRDEIYVQPDEYYITTSQNVIQLEIGQKLPTQLNIQLINGNDGDKASFEWVVDDGRIIDADALDLPLGKGVKYETRSIRNRAQADIKSVTNTLALVTPKKVGMAKIVVSHPKSKSAATVICKVYPRGTFANLPFILESDVPAGGLIKVDTTKPDTQVKLKMAYGDANDVGNLDWSVKNPALADLQDMKRLENYIHGISKGVTKLVVENMNLKNPYEAAVIVGTTEELALMSVLYAEQVYQTVAVGQSISVQIKNSNDDITLTNNDQYTVGIYDKTKFAATMIKSRLLLQGLAETTSGPIAITIGNSSSPEIASTQVIVTVVPGEITISQPYTLTGPNFIGMNYGQEKDVKVALTGANPVEKDKVAWKSEDSGIVRVTGNGEEAKFRAGNTLSQTNISVSHSKSLNEKIIVAYVVPPGVVPEKAVVLGIEKDHWLLKTGDEVMMQLITNADETPDKNINNITWGGNDISVASVDYNGSRAIVKAKKAGSTVITVTHPQKAIDLKIYISVSDMPLLSKEITLPSIVEMIIGENKVVTAAVQGLSDTEIKNITWSIDDSNVVGISGEGVGLTGGKVFLQGKDRGQAWLTARQDSFGYMRKILVVCARSYEELMNTYVMTSEESYYRIKVGESRDIRLIFGSAGFPEDKKQYITWKDEGNKVVKIYDGGGGDHARIEAAALGITTVTIDHKDISKPVSITFETYNESITGTNYAFNSNTLMMGLVVKKPSDFENNDNTKVLQAGIFPQGPSYTLITAADEEPARNIFSFSKVSNEFRITGTAKGQSWLRISHPQVAEDLRVLIYTADSKTELDKMFPIGLSKPNYLLTIGDPVSQYIRITTPSETAPDYADKIRKISWSIDNTRVVDYVISADKKEVKIDGRNTGNCVFDIKYDNVTVEKAYVSVKAAAADMGRKIVTESIIGLTPGQTMRKTTIGSNLTDAEKKDLKWRTSNSAVVSIAPVENDFGSQYITAVSAGEAEVTVSFGQIERYIKVYVSADINSYKAVNLDNRYYQLRKNDEMTITAFHAAQPCSADDVWSFYPLNNQVIEMEPAGNDKIKIKGINEGITAIILHNNDYAAGAVPMTDVQFLIEVSNTAPRVEDVTDDWYMTAFKTVYALDPAKTQDWTRVRVNGIRFPEEQLTQIKWRAKSEESNGVKKELGENETSSLIDFYPVSGTFVDIAPKNKTGTVILEASHPRSVNKALEITVICNAATVLAKPVAHIVSGKEIVKLQKYESQNFTVRIEDLPGGAYDITKFTVTSDNPSKVSAQVTGGQVTVRGVEFGQALITIAHPDVPDMQKKIVVMVLTSGDLIYLTTRQNFVVLEKNNYQAVEVDLIGFEDINNRNYIWSTDDWDIISLNDSGKTAVVTAKDVAKTAKITVQHAACPEYPLYIYVRVTDKLGAKPVYITAGNNIVSLKEGVSMRIKSTLVNGEAHEFSEFQWSTGDRNIIELNFSGDTAMIKGIRAGTAQVVVWHPSSLNSINIIVIVEPAEPNNGIYITTDTLLVEMSTTERQRLIRARLVGGTNDDIYGFQWAITQWQSRLRKEPGGESYQVIDMNANADMCYIYPHSEGASKYEGEATLTISHPKSNYKLDIKIVVEDDVNIVFGESYITINQFAQATVAVSASSSSRLGFSSTNSAVVTVEGTNKLCVINGVGAGTAIIIASNMSGTKSAELIVKVNAVDLNDYYYLQTDMNIVMMNTTTQMTKLSGWVVNAKTGKKDDFLTGQLKWKIKDSDQSLEVVKLNGLPKEAVVTHDNVIVYPVKQGEIEVIFGFFQKNDPLFETYKTLANTCSGKSIYVKVEQASTQFHLSHSVVTLKEGESLEGVWAKIEPAPPDINYGKDGDITWRSEKPDVVAVIYRSNANNQSNVSLQSFKTGNVQIFVNYGNTQQVIAVIVTANAYIHSTMTAFNVMPNTSQVFTITSNPKNANITMTVDSNMWVTLKCRQKGVETDWRSLQGDFKTQTDDQMGTINPDTKLPYDGFEIMATGGVSEGVTTITFEMKSTGQKLQVMITNVKSYFVQYFQVQSGQKVYMTQLRFEPKRESVRVYYDIQPYYDDIRPLQEEGLFRVIPGKEIEYKKKTDGSYDLDWEGKKIPDLDDSGHEKIATVNGIPQRWIDFVRPYRSGSYEVLPTFGTCGKTVNLRTGFTNTVVPLDVYIYYDNLPVSWAMDKAEYVESKDRPSAGDLRWNRYNLRSMYDASNYAATVASFEKLYIKFGIDGDYPGHGLTMKIANNNGDILPPLYAEIDQTGDRIVLSYKPPISPDNGVTLQSTYFMNTKFEILLKVEYSYFSGFKEKVTYTHSILVYTADVVRSLYNPDGSDPGEK